MLQKIISGGQTGTERAALDAARALGLPHGGWIPKGRQTEDGHVPDTYNLVEMSSDILTSHIEMNVFCSDGTLIFSHGDLAGDGLYIKKMAMKHTKPWLHIDLNQIPEFEVANRINNWLGGVGNQVMNITDPSASQGPKVYNKVKGIIESVGLLNKIKARMVDPSVGDNRSYYPKEAYLESVEDIVDHVVGEISPRDRILIANTGQSDLFCLDATLGMYIRRKLDMWSGRKELWAECKALVPADQVGDVGIIEVADQIIGEIWKKLRATHRIRRVK